MIINENGVLEVIGRLIGRAQSHKNSSDQTTNLKKKEAHFSAYQDMISLANDLADATDDPKYAKSHAAYRKAVRLNLETGVYLKCPSEKWVSDARAACAM